MKSGKVLEAPKYKRAIINQKEYYGKHLLLTANQCNEALLSIEKMTSFMKNLVKEIDMIAYGEPIVARFGEGIEEGISGVQLITTSAIMIHTNDAARDMYLDVFSCKWYDEHQVMEIVNREFAPRKMSEQVILRN